LTYHFTYQAWLLSVATATAIAGIVAGVLFSASSQRVRVAIPLSAGLLLGVALFGLLPELAHDLSWALTIAFFGAGFTAMTLFDRAVLAICPDCSHAHEHENCEEPLHGFAAPVLLAAGLHALFDGWALAATSFSNSGAVRVALPLALVLHKIPEGLALGGILKPSMHSRWKAIALASSVEMLTLLGGGVSLALAQRVGSGWTNYPLALAGGFFLFLAAHAFKAEWKRDGRSMFAPGLAGLVVSAALQTGLRSYFGI
jgi:zinc transporter ZupT